MYTTYHTWYIHKRFSQADKLLSYVRTILFFYTAFGDEFQILKPKICGHAHADVLGGYFCADAGCRVSSGLGAVLFINSVLEDSVGGVR